jgi:hypothetical protein
MVRTRVTMKELSPTSYAFSGYAAPRSLPGARAMLSATSSTIQIHSLRSSLRLI